MTDVVAPCARLARSSGAFALLALDQRETLRSLLIQAGRPSSDRDVSEFKVEVARHLSTAASGLLIDPIFGFDAVRTGRVVPDSCGIILAVDTFTQEPGGPVEDTRLDRELLSQRSVDAGARAFKYMVIWRAGRGMGAQHREVEDFVEGCRRLGVACVLEGLVHPGSVPAEAFDDTVLEAASTLGTYQPDVYKGQIPTLGQGSHAEVTRRSREIVASLPCPWVVLSGGVPPDVFPAAVEAACRAGASGFLAGRGIWGPSISAADTRADLETNALERLDRLTRIVDAVARPWQTPRQ